VAVLLLDMDEFKAINDTLGHELGDSVLGQVAARLQAATAGQGTLARMGEDEFAVLVEGDVAHAQALAHELLSDLERPLEIDSLALDVSASIGIACYP
jgi:diguanylate cyclase (GGDEF)-like protein